MYKPITLITIVALSLGLVFVGCKNNGTDKMKVVQETEATESNVELLCETIAELRTLSMEMYAPKESASDNDKRIWERKLQLKEIRKRECLRDTIFNEDEAGVVVRECRNEKDPSNLVRCCKRVGLDLFDYMGDTL